MFGPPRIPLTPIEVKDLQMETSKSLMDLTVDLKDALQAVLNQVGQPVYSYQWARVMALVQALDQTASDGNWKLNNGRSEGYDWRGRPLPKEEGQ